MDRSLSHDDSLNGSFSALPTSTPKKARVVRDSLQNNGEADISANISAVSSLNESSFSFSLLTSSASKKNSKASSQFKTPKPPKPKPKPKYTCGTCLKGYVIKRSFQNHVIAHAVHDHSYKYPNKTAVLDSIGDISIAALTSVANAPCYGETGVHFKEFVGSVVENCTGPAWLQFSSSVCEKLLDTIVGIQFIMPSKIFGKLLEQIEAIYSDLSYSESLLQLINFGNFPPKILFPFFSDFLLNLCFEILKFISKKIMVNHVPKRAFPLQNISPRERKVVHYIGGSIMRTFLRAYYSRPNSKKWKRIKQVVTEKLLTDLPPTDDEDAEWTVSVDRGGLLFISPPCKQFLLNITVIIYSCEKSHGSISFEDVLNEVYDSDVKLQWDNMMSGGGSDQTTCNPVSEILSMHLLDAVVNAMSRTCGRGYAKKRLNGIRKTAYISMPTRHKVASRKNS